jgi:hypothetical protein
MAARFFRMKDNLPVVTFIIVRYSCYRGDYQLLFIPIAYAPGMPLAALHEAFRWNACTQAVLVTDYMSLRDIITTNIRMRPSRIRRWLKHALR